MKLVGSYRLNAPREIVWPLIFDPNSLVSLIPGCQQLERVSPDEYRGQMQVGLAAVGGTYETLVRMMEQEAPHHCRFEGEVSGPTGIIRGEAFFRLKEVDHETAVEYEAEALITGALAKLNIRFIEGVVHTLVNQGLARLNKQLQAEQAAGAAAGESTD